MPEKEQPGWQEGNKESGSWEKQQVGGLVSELKAALHIHETAMGAALMQ